MLFNANITSETLKSEEALCEQLYIFLNNFANKRLTYESLSEKEDCVQETIMYILGRYKKLPKDSIEFDNIEKYFYNRANSFMSGYISKLKKERQANRRYAAEMIENDEVVSLEEEKKQVDYNILNKIIDSFGLTKESNKILLYAVENQLTSLNYEVNPREDLDEEVEEDIVKAFEDISYTVLDEYLKKSINEEGSN